VSANATSAHVGTNELRDLPQTLAEAAARVDRSFGRLYPLWVRGLQHLHRVEGLAAGAVEKVAHALFVERLEPPARIESAREGRGVADVEAGQAGHGHRPGVAAQHARERGAERDGPERRAAGRGRGRQPPCQPPVRRTLHARSARLHVVLRVEVRARRVRRPAGVHDGQPAFVPQRFQAAERRVQPEEAVEIERAPAARGAGNRNAAARRVVVGIAVRDDHAETVHGPALEDHHQYLRPPGTRLRQCAADHEPGHRPHRHERQRALFHERPACAGTHRYLL
jgi:hypothetical protein